MKRTNRKRLHQNPRPQPAVSRLSRSCPVDAVVAALFRVITHCDVSQGARLEAGAMRDDHDLIVPERLRALAEHVLEKGWRDYKTIGLLRDATERSG